MTESTVHTQRSYVVTESSLSPEYSITHTQRAYVVTRAPDAGGLWQGDITKSPNYIVENGTPYVKFDPNTNDKQLFFYPETVGTYQIIALRPNLLDFYEVEQTFSGPAQLIVPHFNQVFMTDRTLEDAERNQIKSAMLARATGTGIDIEFFDFESASVAIVNPDAETGNITGWTASGSGSTFIASTSFSPPQGSWAFRAGEYTFGPEYLSQQVSVSDHATSIDAGSATFKVGYYQFGQNSDDVGAVHLLFRDGSNVQIGSYTPTLVNLGGYVWVQTSTDAIDVPPNTRSVVIRLSADSSGSDIRTLFDALEATITVKSTSENSVPGGLQDPYIPGFLGNPA